MLKRVARACHVTLELRVNGQESPVAKNGDRPNDRVHAVEAATSSVTGTVDGAHSPVS
jgi:hypothetical protein